MTTGDAMDPQPAPPPPASAPAPASPSAPERVPAARPMPAVMAVVILWVVALGTAGLTALLALLSANGGFGTDVRFGAVDAAITLVAIASAVFAVVCILASVGVWRSATWGWALALLVALVGLLSIGTAFLTGGGDLALSGGIVLFGGLLACLLAPAVRARSGIG